MPNDISRLLIDADYRIVYIGWKYRYVGPSIKQSPG